MAENTGAYAPEVLHRLWQVETEIYREFARVCDENGLAYFAAFGTALGAVRHQGFIPWDDDIDVAMPREDYEKLIARAPELFAAPYEVLEPRLTAGYVMPFAKLTRADSTFVEATDTDRTYHSGIFIDIFPMDWIWPDAKRRLRVYEKTFLLARLCVLTEYGKPKLPKGMTGWKKTVLHAGTMAVHGLLRLTGQTTQRLYARYLRAATQTPREEAKGRIADLLLYRQEANYGLDDPIYPEKMLFPTREVPFGDITVRVPGQTGKYLARTFGEDYMTLPPEEKRHCHMPAVLEFPEERP